MATAAHDPFVTTSESQTAMRAWAEARRLAYEPLGLLPPASDFLRRAIELGDAMHMAATQHGRGAVLTFRGAKLRRARFSENLCSGTLPGGAEGTLGHHTFLYRREDEGWAAVCDTVVLVHVPESRRLTAGLVGRPQATRPRTITITKLEYGDNTKEVELAPALRERIYWHVDADEDAQPLQRVFGRDVVAALEAAPELTRVTVRDGWLALELSEPQDDPAVLDALCRAAAALAGALRREGSSQRTLDPAAGALAPPPDSPYRQYLDRGVASVSWEAPPPDVATAIERYLQVTKDDAHAERRGRRGFAFFVGLFAVLGVVVALPTALSSIDAALVVFGATVLLGVVLGLVSGRQVRQVESHDRATAFGREAFAREYARARGLRMEDAEELRRRLPVPLDGRPERSFHGDLGDGVRGRLVWWRDRSHPDRGDRAYMLAVVPAPAGEPVAQPPFATLRAGGWLVVVHDLDAQAPGEARTVAGIDRLRAEAVRLARA